MLGDDRGVGFPHRGLDGFGQYGAAIHAPEMLDRHLARPEAVDADPVLESDQTLADLGIEIGDRDHHPVFTLQAFGYSLRNLHVGSLFVFAPADAAGAGSLATTARSGRAWCGRRDSNPHDFRHGNLNPARLPIPPRPLGQLSRARPARTDAALDPPTMPVPARATKIGHARGPRQRLVGERPAKPAPLRTAHDLAAPRVESSAR